MRRNKNHWSSPSAVPSAARHLRWRPPVPHAPWFAPLEATQFANHCAQPPSPFGIASVTEDCLFLNVFTPDSNDFFQPRAVMVWIHGGALTFGESNHYDPTALVQDGVIVVTINYRLGALGFLAHPAFAGERRMRIGTATAIPIPLVIMASWISNSLSAGFATTSCSSAAIR
jgi:para-nitrobenzyl esterase